MLTEDDSDLSWTSPDLLESSDYPDPDDVEPVRQQTHLAGNDGSDTSSGLADSLDPSNDEADTASHETLLPMSDRSADADADAEPDADGDADADAEPDADVDAYADSDTDADERNDAHAASSSECEKTFGFFDGLVIRNKHSPISRGLRIQCEIRPCELVLRCGCPFMCKPCAASMKRCERCARRKLKLERTDEKLSKGIKSICCGLRDHRKCFTLANYIDVPFRPEEAVSLGSDLVEDYLRNAILREPGWPPGEDAYPATVGSSVTCLSKEPCFQLCAAIRAYLLCARYGTPRTGKLRYTDILRILQARPGPDEPLRRSAPTDQDLVIDPADRKSSTYRSRSHRQVQGHVE